MVIDFHFRVKKVEDTILVFIDVGKDPFEGKTKE